VTWNTAELTVTALRRLLDTDQGVEIRLLVRDNGSTDGTPEAIAERVPEASLDADDRNLGFAAGMNTLLARSDAPWFFALNPDAWPMPGAIGRLVEAAQSWPRAAAVAPRLERPDGEIEHSTHPFPSARVAGLLALGLSRVLPERTLDRFALEGHWHHDRPRTVDWAVGAALLMRRAALDDIGGFDERFFMYAEDLEWCWRAHTRGWEIRFDPSAVVVHVGNASGAQAFADTRIGRHYHNTYRFYREAHGTAACGLYRALNLAGCLRLSALARMRGDSATAAQWRDVARVHRHPERYADVPGDSPAGS
jgi:GT2 family glycosyltransferase